jgi:hypothetical protein
MRKESPIIFSTEMVKAILDGRKTQTRRILKIKGCKPFIPLPADAFKKEDIDKWNKDYNPYGQPGDLLWVREKWENESNDGKWVNFYAGNIEIENNHSYKILTRWKPSIHMPKVIARIWLEVINVRVQKLNDITPGDACDEGIEYCNIDVDAFKGGELQADFKNYTWKDIEGTPDYFFPTFANPIDSFRTLWQSINGDESWNANPWVWVIEFKVLSTNGKP